MGPTSRCYSTPAESSFDKRVRTRLPGLHSAEARRERAIVRDSSRGVFEGMASSAAKKSYRRMSWRIHERASRAERLRRLATKPARCERSP